MAKFLLLICLVMLSVCACAPLDQRPALDYPPQPLIYEDVATHTVFYVETDRCHVSAVQNGKVLWTRDMCSSMEKNQRNLGRINSIGAIPSGKSSSYVGIGFNTGEFGEFKMSNGDFTDVGCD
jgi:hypothetical protein